MTGQLDRVIFTVDEDEIALMADLEMLTTAFINLIDNALKYTPGDKAINNQARRQGHDVVVEIREHGIGIPPNQLHRIGRRFFRASNASSRSGSGLGLYTSRKLLAYHNRTLALSTNVEDEPRPRTDLVNFLQLSGLAATGVGTASPRALKAGASIVLQSHADTSTNWCTPGDARVQHDRPRFRRWVSQLPRLPDFHPASTRT